MPKVAEPSKGQAGCGSGPARGRAIGLPGSASRSARGRATGWAPRGSRVPGMPAPAAWTGWRRAPSCGPAPSGRHWAAEASISRSYPMSSDPTLLAGRRRPARGQRRARGTPARGCLATRCARGSAPCRRRRQRGAGGPAGGGRRAARESGRAEGARAAGVCAPPAVRSRPRAGAATRVVRLEGATARAHQPARPRRPQQLGGCSVLRPRGE